MNDLFVITAMSWDVLREDKDDFTQSDICITVGKTKFSKNNLDKIVFFRGKTCILTFEMEKITTYQKMLEKDYFCKAN